MKKLFLIGLAATAMLTSCNDETIEMNQTNAISFDNAFVDNSTRAFSDPSLTMGNLSDFSVWSYMDAPAGKVLADVKVAKSGQAWTYSPLAYWVGGHTYTFAAVAPTTSRIWAPVENGGELKGFTVAANNGTQDILYSTKVQVETPAQMVSSPGAVAFTFKHMLAKVKFTFTNAYSNPNYTIKVSNIKITNAYKAGECNLTAWTGSDETLTLDFGNATTETSTQVNTEAAKIEINNSARSNNELLLIPSTAEKSYNISFTAELSIGATVAGTYNLTSTISGVALEMGKSYNFTASLDQTNINPDGASFPIEFTVTGVDQWVDYQDVPQTL